MHHIRTPMKPSSRNPATTAIATTPPVLIVPPGEPDSAVGFGVGDGGDETFDGDGGGGAN